ncbi:glycosyltransferase involved in cell wall biosynthesis [Desulfurispira natronophila]|uniref:Glycosyltransferase involved in cell wall biosynthesis n=2 Tax=Desulfurispira natronophila TaxID=682562 RepID=A0A7W7Y4G4_9BACT|nr:glycosyltransferase involved in cell wall biosynthesis [Desulfurispira natronophila]
MEIICPEKARGVDHFAEAGIPVYFGESVSRIDRNIRQLIRERLSQFQPDILHLLNSKAISNGIAASRGFPVKVIAYRGVVGGVSFLDPASWMTYLHPRVSRVICVADAIRQWFVKHRLFHYPPEERFITIHKGHDVSWYNPAPRHILQDEFGIPSDAPVVVSIANYRKHKGLELLIESAQDWPDEAHLLLIGNMEGSPLQGLAKQSAARHRIHFAGSRSDAAALTGACDIYALCAYKKEGLPKTVIEAMCQGVPPVVANSGGSPELIEENVSGLIVPPQNLQALSHAINTLLQDPPRRITMGRAARDRIQKAFAPQQTVKQTLQLYNELTGINSC